MSKQYQIVQERFEPGSDGPTLDEYPVLFSSIEDARERAKRGFEGMFEHKGDNYYIAELEPYRDGVTYTGRQFPLDDGSETFADNCAATEQARYDCE